MPIGTQAKIEIESPSSMRIKPHVGVNKGWGVPYSNSLPLKCIEILI